MSRRFYRIKIVAVDEGMRGKGAFRRLVTPILDYADKEKIPVVLGLYGQVNVWQGIILILCIYIIQAIWSQYWLKYYRFGPFEWAWRSLTYWKMQPMKK